MGIVYPLKGNEELCVLFKVFHDHALLLHYENKTNKCIWRYRKSNQVYVFL